MVRFIRKQKKLKNHMSGQKARWGGGEGAGLHSTFSHQLTKSENMM